MPEDHTSQEQSYEALVKALDDPETRENAIRELGARGDPRAVPHLGTILKPQDDVPAYGTRKLAARALGDIAHADAVPHLSAALDEQDETVKLAAARALGSIHTPDSVDALLPLLEDDSPQAREVAVHALSTLSKSQDVPIRPLAGRLSDSTDAVRHAAREAILGMGDVYQQAITVLDHSNSTVRGAIADILAELGDERAVEHLRDRLLEENSRWVRSRVERAVRLLTGESVDTDDAPLPEGSIPPPQRTLDSLRQSEPTWPGFGKDLEPVEASMGTEDTVDSRTMSADDIRALLDKLDMRLAKGEISEATHKMLYERWQSRLEGREKE